ncbi:TPM domain-containing protein [Sphingobium boeckii]|uniref:TPM domain-containing protein n=1 Tax=Sphingobium boeckii TaxID=1082345 RepID=A0A7W9ECN1_9SPHN|nr:TPM domain-containing protein [Sphingobium boeckii]MBB5684453.1 uncharacterized protein [Sphingobium boeckii]
MNRLLAVFLLLIAAWPAHAQTFPALTGRVVDQANVIPDDREAALVAKLQAFEQQTGRQFVVATIADMEGRTLEDYGYRLGRAWGIGSKEEKNGVILFLAPNNPPGQRGPRIEVGYGLEPILTDALSRIIISRQMMPRLRDGDIAGAIDAGADAVMQQISLPPEEAAKRQQQLLAAEKEKSSGGSPLILIFWLVVILFIAGQMFFARRGNRKYRGGSAPVVIWGGGSDWGSSGGGWGGGGSSWGGSDGGGFSGGGGSFGGGGASGDW